MIDVRRVDRATLARIDKILDRANRFVEADRVDPKTADAKASASKTGGVRDGHAQRLRAAVEVAKNGAILVP